MSDTSKYSTVEKLRNGRQVEISALRPDAEAGFVAPAGRVSAQSLFRRFFAAKRGFTEQEVAFFVNVDFIDHVALVAVVGKDNEPVIVGSARYIIGQPGQAEVAFAVVDEYQGQGIGAALMHQ